MTPRLVDPEPEALSQRLRNLIRTKYRTQTKAAQAWGVSQSAVSRLINGQRGPDRSEALQKIAAAEGASTDSLLMSPVETRMRVREVRTQSEQSPRFVYDAADPHRMLKQVQSWFADLPLGTRLKRQLTKAVMRTLLDESFDFEIHHPGAAWRPVMDSIEGWLFRTRRGHIGRTP